MLRLILLSLLLTPIFGQGKDPRQEANEILDRLLDKAKYDPCVRPNNKNETGADIPTIITTNIYIRSIDYICTKKMELSGQITFRQQWNDPRLKFENKEEIKYLNLVDDTRIWKPDTFFSNSKHTERMVDLQPNVLMRIYPNGNVLYSIRLNVVLSCPMDLKHYPFDIQVCPLQLASYGFTTDDLVFLWKENEPVQVTKNLLLSEFSLTSFITDYCTSRTNTGEYSCIKTNLNFKRESSKYICQWFIPTAILTIISFASFCLKSKSTRLRLLVVTLVLLYLHVLYISNKASPRTSYTNAKDCWVSTCLLFVLAAFVELAIVRLVDRMSRRNKTSEATEQNGKTHCEEGDAVAMKPLVEEGKEDNKDEDAKQYTVNKGVDRRNFSQKWKESPTACRIDMISSILFPLLFIIYIITFFSYETLRA